MELREEGWILCGRSDGGGQCPKGTTRPAGDQQQPVLSPPHSSDPAPNPCHARSLRTRGRQGGSLPRSPPGPTPSGRRGALAPPLTRQSGGEAEGVVAVALLVAGPVAADPWPTSASARSARREHRVAHGALEQPSRVTPVQTLRPRWREMGGVVGGLGASPAGAGREHAPAGAHVAARRGPGSPRVRPLTLVQLGVGGQASVLLFARLLRLVVIELVPAPAGLVRKHHTWGVADSLGRAGRRGEESGAV